MFNLIQQKNNKNSLAFCTNVFLFLTIILFLIGLATDPLKIQYNLFFHDFTDLLADFFNHIIYTADCNPYWAVDESSTHRILPPLHYALAYGVRQFIDCEMTLEAMWKDPKAMGCAIVFLTCSEIFMLFMLSKLIENKKNYITLLLLVFTGINLYAIERGTMAIFSAGCIAGFLHYYQYPERKIQLFSLVLLSLSASLKIYPALFGLFLLKKRDCKAIIFCILLTSALGFLPLLMFKGGFGNLKILFGNLEKYRIFFTLSSQQQVLRNFLIFCFKITNYQEVIDFLKVLVDIIAITTLCVSFLNNNRERMTLAIASVITLCPIGAAPYTQCYLFAPFLFFMNRASKSCSKFDIFMAAGYILLFMPYQFAGKINELFILFVLPAMLTAQCIIELKELKNSKKSFREILTDCFKKNGVI